MKEKENEKWLVDELLPETDPLTLLFARLYYCIIFLLRYLHNRPANLVVCCFREVGPSQHTKTKKTKI